MARIECLPCSLQGFLNEVHHLQLVSRTAEPGFVLCTLPSQQVSSSLHDLLRKMLQGTWLALLVWFLTQCALAGCCAMDCNMEWNCYVCYTAYYLIVL